MGVIETVIRGLMFYSPVILLNLINLKKKNDEREINRKINYKLYKDGIADSVLKMATLPYQSFELILNIEEWFDGPYPEELKDIFSKFVQYIDPLNLESCIVNLRSVKIEDSVTFREFIYNLLSTQGVSGSYYSGYNLIKLIKNKKHVLSHEFLHMASTSTMNRSLCGFSVMGYDTMHQTTDYFGTGLNEGYTELLNGRFFNDGKIYSYPYNVQIVKLIECFFDDYKEMESAYFHNNIDAVYKAFCKYGTREEYFSIMNSLDNYATVSMLDDYFDALKVQFKILEIIKRSNDEDKIKKCEEIIRDNKIADFFMKRNAKLKEPKGIKK